MIFETKSYKERAGDNLIYTGKISMWNSLGNAVGRQSTHPMVRAQQACTG